MKSNAIEIQQLRKRFPNFQLGPLDLSVPQGAIYGFVGPNGSGKTTTLDLIFGMGSADSGSISVLGLDHRYDEVAMKQQVAYVTPELTFQSWGKVSQVIQFIKGFYKTWDQDYCHSLLQRFKIGFNDKILALSFGNRIKLSLILALARRPKILILDEPTVGLDAVSKRDVFGQLLSMLEDGDHTVLIASHGLADLERFTDHIGIINEGTMIIQGPTDLILESHQHIDFRLSTTPPQGARIVHHDGDHYRVLSSGGEDYRSRLERLGAEGLVVKPVSLEELFLGLVEGEAV